MFSYLQRVRFVDVENDCLFEVYVCFKLPLLFVRIEIIRLCIAYLLRIRYILYYILLKIQFVMDNVIVLSEVFLCISRRSGTLDRYKVRAAKRTCCHGSQFVF